MTDISGLTHVRPIFKRFNSGAHINREQELELWKELEDHLDDYTALFSALGFSLVLDARGFAYFKTDQGSSYTGKQSRKLALIIMLLFEYQADHGLHLFQFKQWRIDAELIANLWQQYQAILTAEEFTDASAIKEVLDSATRVGFAVSDENAYLLLPAVHRYLDLFEELAQSERNDDAVTITPAQEGQA